MNKLAAYSTRDEQASRLFYLGPKQASRLFYLGPKQASSLFYLGAGKIYLGGDVSTIIRRVLMGMVIGLVMSGLFLAFMISVQMILGVESALEPWRELQGLATLWVVGALVGAGMGLLVSPVPAGVSEDMMSGLLLGVVAWLVVWPMLMGGASWDARAIGDGLPQLIAYLLQGALIGLLYGAVCELFGRRLGLLDADLGPVTRPVASKRVVVVGGGYAGVAAAQELDRQFAADPRVEIYIVSEINYQIHTPMLSEVMAGSVNAQNISPPLRSFFKRVRVVQGEVKEIDLEMRCLGLKPNAHSPYEELPFDYLVLAMGNEPYFREIKGVEENAFTFKSLEDAMLLRNHMIDMLERADFEKDVERRRQMLTFVVAGGGFAGAELIGAINDFTRGVLHFYPNIPPEELQMILVHSRDVILQELSDTLGKFALEKLQERGVQFVLNTRVNEAQPGAVQTKDKKSKILKWIPTETFVWTAGNKPSQVLEGLDLTLTKRGQIEVNTKLAVPGVEGLWAIGDCARIPDLTSTDPDPKKRFAPPTAQHALREGKIAGYNVAATIKGQPLKEFKFKTLGLLAALGHQLAVAEFQGFLFSGFLAWQMWRFIYLSKLPTLQKKVRVGLDWLLDLFFPSDIVKTTININAPSAKQRLRQRQSRKRGFDL
ncbi:MAG: NAD(P)/FAD-dependent oxidoreductase [Ardenticatenaceae bacterium]